MTIGNDILTPPADVETHSAAVFFCQQIEQLGLPGNPPSPRVLVAGCGAGHEAAYLADRLAAFVEAFDIDHAPDPLLVGRSGLRFQQASVENVPFGDQSFDAVFYHHVIEHVGNPRQSLCELARVLRPGGWLFIGTPNRSRLFSAVGAHRQRDWSPSLRSKLRENLQDWQARLRGRFRNEYGEHAGYTERELDAMLADLFVLRRWVTRDYLRFKYAQHPFGSLVRAATTDPVRWFLAPSVYAIARK